MCDTVKKEILTFIFDGYADWESAYICAELNAEDTEYVVKTISFDKFPKKSMAGFTVIPDYTIDEYPKAFAMLLLIGGKAWQEKQNEKVKPIVDYAVAQGIPVGAICGATFFMAENGYLDQVKHTSNTLEFMKAQAPHYRGDAYYIEKQAASDQNIITANGTATLEFAKEILLCLKVKSKKQIEQWYQFNKQGFYKNECYPIY